MTQRVWPGDTLTIAMNFSGNVKRQQQVTDQLHVSFPHLKFNLIDVYTMAPAVLWVEGEPLDNVFGIDPAGSGAIPCDNGNAD